MWRTRTINRKRFFGTKAHFIAKNLYISQKNATFALEETNTILYQRYTKRIQKKGKKKRCKGENMHKNAAAALIFTKKFVYLEKKV